MFYYLCSVMRRIFIIVLFLLGGLLFEKGDFAPTQNLAKFEFSDRHNVQLECCHRYNIDAERTSSVAVPSVRTITAHSARYSQQRTLSLSFVEHHQTTSNYSVAHFVHRRFCLFEVLDYGDTDVSLYSGSS